MKKKILLFIVLVLGSCSDSDKENNQTKKSTTHTPDSVVLALNDKAVKLIGEAAISTDSLNGLLYDSAIIYLDEAIDIDSLYLLAYTNKAQALQRKGFLKESLQVLGLVETIKPDFAEVIMAQGFIMEKMGNFEFSKQKYEKALQAYEDRLKKDPNNEKAQSDIAFLYIFLKDKNVALGEIRNLLLENPESEQLKLMERVIMNIDREKFIEEY